MVKFIFVLGLACLITALASLLWPRFTNKERPQPLTRIHDFLVHTEPGQQAALVLGVSDEEKVIPFNAQRLVGEMAQGAVSRIQQRTQDVVVTQLTRQFQQLPETQRAQIQQIICQQQSVSSGSGNIQ